MASSSNLKKYRNQNLKRRTHSTPREYAKVEMRRLLKDDNLYELHFNEIGSIGCTYFLHRKRQRHSTMYVIPCEFTLKNQIFRKLFDGDDVDLSKGTIIHDCHKICNDCLGRFKNEGGRCKLCPNDMDMDYKIHCKPMLNLWICQGFIIQSLIGYHALMEGCKNYISTKKDNTLLGLVIQCEVKLDCTLYNSTTHVLNLPMEITMHISYSNIPNKNNTTTNTTPYWNMSEYNNDVYKWEDVFQDENLVPTISKSLVIFDGIKVNLNTKNLELDHIILIYVPHMLSEGTYSSTSRLANVYYEVALLYGNIGKKKAQTS